MKLIIALVLILTCQLTLADNFTKVDMWDIVPYYIACNSDSGEGKIYERDRHIAAYYSGHKLYDNRRSIMGSFDGECDRMYANSHLLLATRNSDRYYTQSGKLLGSIKNGVIYDANHRKVGTINSGKVYSENSIVVLSYE